MLLTYDAGALVAAESRNPHLLALHDEALQLRIRPVVPSVVLAQVWRGGPQPVLSRVLAGCDIEELSERHARGVGRALARSGTSDVVDAAVVVSAATRGGLIVTGDRPDLERVADAVDAEVEFQQI